MGGHADVRRLVLLRHAKAEPAGTVPDELRRLDARGRRQAREVGVGLVAAGLLPERVVVSSAVRTRETWEEVLAGLGDAPAPEVESSDLVYRARHDDVVDLVRSTDERVRTLLVVGHEPAMSAAAAFLAGAGDPGLRAQVGVGLATAAYAVLEVADPWAELERLGATLTAVVRPA